MVYPTYIVVAVHLVILTLIPLCYCRPNIDLVKDADNPCSAAKLHVKGKNHEGGNWTVKLGELEASVAHHVDGKVENENLAGEWEAALYRSDTDCNEEIGPGPGEPTVGPGVIPDDYYIVDGVGSYKLHTSFLSFDRAVDTCQSEGADLAVINSKAEVDALKDLFENNRLLDENEIINDQAFVGLTRDDDGNFVTLDGENVNEIGYSNWASEQPDNFMNDEGCAAVLRNGKLNDVPCWLDISFFCEINSW